MREQNSHTANTLRLRRSFVASLGGLVIEVIESEGLIIIDARVPAESLSYLRNFIENDC